MEMLKNLEYKNEKRKNSFHFFVFLFFLCYNFITLILIIGNMKTKIKNIAAAIKAWDEKNTNFHSNTYMLIFLTAAAVVASNLNQAAAAL